MHDFFQKHPFPFKLLVSAGLLGYCFYLLDISVLRAISIKWQWFGLALVLILLDNIVGAVRFKTLINPITRFSLARHVKYYFWASFFNAALPTSIGGDAMRILWLRRQDVSIDSATVFVFLERLLGVAMLILIACGAALFLEIPSSLRGVLASTTKLTLSLMFFGLVIIYWLRKLPYIRNVLNQLTGALQQLTLVTGLSLFLLTFAYQALTIMISICIAVGIGIYLDWNVWFFIVPLLWLLTVLPISVGGLGVREVGLVFFLSAYGESKEHAVALGLATFVTYLAAGVLGGIWYSVDSGSPKETTSLSQK